MTDEGKREGDEVRKEGSKERRKERSGKTAQMRHLSVSLLI